jgi:tetratricopeptide (TPR) repeat protein/TolB-like protein
MKNNILLAFGSIFLIIAALSAPVFGSQMTVGVIPFNNLTKSEELAWFGEGIAQKIGAELAKNPALEPVGKEKIKRALMGIGFNEEESMDVKRAADVGMLVGAAVIIFGDYQKFADKMQITAHIIKVSTGNVLGTISKKGEVDNIFDLQDQTVASVGDHVKRTLTGSGKTTPGSTAEGDKVAADSKEAAKPKKTATTKAAARPKKGYSAAKEDEATMRIIAQQKGGGVSSAGEWEEGRKRPMGYSAGTENEATRILLQRQMAMDKPSVQASTPKERLRAKAGEWYNKGVELGDSSDQEMAYYKKALEIDPTFERAYYNLGSIYIQRGMVEESIIYFRRFLTYCQDPVERAEIQNLLAQIEGSPTSPPPVDVGPASAHTAEEWYNMGRGLNDNSVLEIEYYKKAIEVDPTFPSAHYNLGLVYHTIGKYELALKEFREFMLYSKDYAEVERVRRVVKQLETYLAQ